MHTSCVLFFKHRVPNYSEFSFFACNLVCYISDTITLQRYHMPPFGRSKPAFSKCPAAQSYIAHIMALIVIMPVLSEQFTFTVKKKHMSIFLS